MSTAHDIWKAYDEVTEQRSAEDLSEEAVNLDAELALRLLMNDGLLPDGYG